MPRRADTASLEALIEGGGLGLDVFHPGGQAMTRELAGLTGIGPGTKVLDVAAGTGETARLFAESYAGGGHRPGRFIRR